MEYTYKKDGYWIVSRFFPKLNFCRMASGSQPGNGFADWGYLPECTYLNLAFVVKLKWDKTTENAIKQIKSKGYMPVLKEYKGNILFVGINYGKKGRKDQCRVEKLEM